MFKKQRKFNILEKYASNVARWLASGIPILPPPGHPDFQNDADNAAYDAEYARDYPAMAALYNKAREEPDEFTRS